MEAVPGELVLAVDLGGTKISTALVSPQYRVVARDYQLTLAAEGPQPVVARLIAAIERILADHSISPTQLHGISIAAAGAIDRERGLITLSPNLPGWHDIALREIVSARFGVGTFLINDAKAAALGEHRLGAGQGVDNLIVVTVGTGIGGGIIINGSLYYGTSGSAGEIGHMTIDVNGPKCACGNTGCWEMLASGAAMTREAVRRIGLGENSLLNEMVKGRLTDITGEKIEAAARRGDPLAQQIVARTAQYLGVGLVNLVNIFSPGMITVGGGLAKMGDLLLEPARRLMRERAFHQASSVVRIVPAQLGPEAGVLGAAVFARESDR
jgi:glucokinase